MLAEYTGVLVVFVIGLIIVGGMLAVHLLVGPKREFFEKQEPFECGESQIVSRAFVSRLMTVIESPPIWNNRAVDHCAYRTSFADCAAGASPTLPRSAKPIATPAINVRAATTARAPRDLGVSS